MKRAVGRFLEWTVLVLITALATVVVVGIIFRKAGAALVWYDEVASILLAWLTYYGAALAALKRAHIGVPTLVEWLQGRTRVIVILAAEAVVITFFVAVAWSGWQVTKALGQITLVSLPSVSAAVAQSVIPIGAVLFIAAEIVGLRDVLAQVSSTTLRKGTKASWP